MEHHLFLDPNHVFRLDNKSFVGIKEFRAIPNPLSATQILEQLEGFQNEFWKGHPSVCSIKMKKDAKRF